MYILRILSELVNVLISTAESIKQTEIENLRARVNNIVLDYFADTYTCLVVKTN